MRCCIWKKHKRQAANIDDLAQQQSLVLKKTKQFAQLKDFQQTSFLDSRKMPWKIDQSL